MGTFIFGHKRTLIQELNCVMRRIGVAYSFNIRETGSGMLAGAASTKSSAKKSTMFSTNGR